MQMPESTPGRVWLFGGSQPSCRAAPTSAFAAIPDGHLWEPSLWGLALTLPIPAAHPGGKLRSSNAVGAEHAGAAAAPSCILFLFPFHACSRAPRPAEVSPGYSLLRFPCSCHALPVSL